MPLAMLKVGETNSIKNILGNDNTIGHLKNLGFVTGEKVTIVAQLAGNLIVNIKDSRVALSKSMANRIIV